MVAPSLLGFQAVIKNRWPDRSAKFAILSGRANLTAGVPFKVDLLAGTAGSRLAALTEDDLIAQSPSARINFGGAWVELSSLIGRESAYDPASNRFTPGKLMTFVTGPEMSSFIYSSGIGSDPMLTAWFEVRLYRTGDIEILPWIENPLCSQGWAHEQDRQRDRYYWRYHAIQSKSDNRQPCPYAATERNHPFLLGRFGSGADHEA